jgi:peptide/nickel transport system substrate-binding protein
MRFSRLFLAVAAASALASCGSDSADPTAGSTGGTMIIALAAEPVDLFPPLVSELSGRLVMDQIFDRLAEIKPTMETVGDNFDPRLAKSWTWAPDSLSIAFNIDPAARWHDGKPVTASDVRYSFRTFVDPKVGSPAAPLFATIDSVSVRDSLTAVVWFKKHTPEQFYDVAYQLVVFPEHVYGAIPPAQLHTSPVARAPVGSGRFKFSKWEPGVRLEMISDTANFRGRAKLDRVIIAPTEPTVAESRVLSGEIDFMDAFPIDHVGQLDSSTVAGPLIFPNFGFAFMGMNRYDPKNGSAPHPIFSDIRVRRALAMGVDRQAMLQNVFGNKGRISHGPFPMTVGYADSTLKVPPFDTATAKAMLDSSGWRMGPDSIRVRNGQPLRFTLTTPSTSLFRRKYAVLLQEQFRKLGARVEVDVVDQNMMIDRMTKTSFDAIMGGFNPDAAVSGMKQLWTSEGIGYVAGKGVSGQNSLRYANPRVDALIDSAIMAFDPAKAKSYSSRASQIIVDDVPAIFLYDFTLVYALHRRITPTGMRPDEWWAALADWTVAPDKRIDRDRIGLGTAKN